MAGELRSAVDSSGEVRAVSRRGVVTGLLGAGAAAAAVLLDPAQAAEAAPAGDERPWERTRLGTSVKSFGAVGDGVTDDTVAIQAAVDSVRSHGGGTVFFPAGTYAISAALNITSGTEWYNKDGFWLVGEGAGSRIMRSSPTATHTLISFIGPAGHSDATAQTGGYLQNVGMRDLIIGSSDPSNSPQGASPAVTLSKTVQFAIEDCVIEQAGGSAIDFSDAYIGRISGNVIRLSTDGLVFHGTANAVRICDNRIQNVSGTAVSFADPDDSPAGYDARAVTIYIAGNDIEGNGKYAILLGDLVVFEAITIIGNHFESNWSAKYAQGDGPFIFKTPGGGAFCRGISVIGNRFLNFTRSEQAVVFAKGTNISVISNSFVAKGGGPTARDNGYVMGSKVSHWFAGPTDAGSLETDGEVRVHDAGAGIVLTSPDGASHRVLVADDGTLTTAPA